MPVLPKPKANSLTGVDLRSQVEALEVGRGPARGDACGQVVERGERRASQGLRHGHSGERVEGGPVDVPAEVVGAGEALGCRAEGEDAA